MKERVINPNIVDVNPRYINCVGFMLLARDQIALELDQDVDPNFGIKNVIQDTVE